MWAYNALIDSNNRFNLDDFKYYVKMLFENGKVYVSEEALRLIETNPCNFTEEDINNLKNGNISDVYLQNKSHNYTFKCDNGSIRKLIWEHVVPTKVLIDKFLESEHTLDVYKNILERGVVCIVTDEEDKRLSKLGLRSQMPYNENIDIIWSRYMKAGIKVKSIDYEISN